MNYVFISPDFPKTYFRFCKELKANGANVLGIATSSYSSLSDELKSSLTEYYQVYNMEDLEAMKEACRYFENKYGHLDFIESNNEYWLETDAKLRSCFNVTTGKNADEILFFKSKEAMKLDYKKANVKTARYHIPTTLEEGKKFVSLVGYPLVAKPDNGVGAYKTFKINNEDDLVSFYSNKPSIKYIMEEFINGELISFDGISDKDANVVFCTNEVFPDPIMNIVNGSLDCYYYSNISMPSDLLEQGKRVLKAFDAKYRYFHLEFFRLLEDKVGLGKKGELVGLEVNMRSPGGYTPDIINFSKSVNTYKIFADVMCFNKTNENLDMPKYYCGYYGRRDSNSYKHSEEEIRNKYYSSLKVVDRMPDILSGAMGNNFFIINCSTKEELIEMFKYIGERN